MHSQFPINTYFAKYTFLAHDLVHKCYPVDLSLVLDAEFYRSLAWCFLFDQNFSILLLLNFGVISLSRAIVRYHVFFGVNEWIMCSCFQHEGRTLPSMPYDGRSLACNRTLNPPWQSAVCFPAETITVGTVGKRVVWSKHFSVWTNCDRTQLLSNLHSQQIRTPEPLSIFTHWLLSDSYWMCHTAQCLPAAVPFDPLERVL